MKLRELISELEKRKYDSTDFMDMTLKIRAMGGIGGYPAIETFHMGFDWNHNCIVLEPYCNLIIKDLEPNITVVLAEKNFTANIDGYLVDRVYKDHAGNQIGKQMDEKEFVKAIEDSIVQWNKLVSELVPEKIIPGTNYRAIENIDQLHATSYLGKEFQDILEKHGIRRLKVRNIKRKSKIKGLKLR